MKIQRYVYMALIFLVLISVSAVSAAEDTANDIISADDNQELILEDIQEDVSTSTNNDDELILEDENDDVPFLKQTDDNEIIAGVDNGTFEALENKINNAQNGSTIILENDYTYEGEESGISGITIGKALTIDGAGHTINANEKRQIFYINESAQVTIKNLKLISGRTEEYEGGGAIHNNGELTIMNSTFTNNKARYGNVICNGGAIYNDGTVIIMNSTFINNTAYTGGAVYSMTSSAIQESTFINNTASSFGGAVYGSNAITGSTFINNTASSSGGAIYNSMDMTMSNSTFINNTANSGGAIYVFVSRSIIMNSTFINNTAYNGGAMDCNSTDYYDYQAIVMNSKFTNNTATDGSGAIDNQGRLTIVNSTITNNDIHDSSNKLDIEGFIPFLTTEEFTVDIVDFIEGNPIKITSSINYNVNTIVNITNINTHNTESAVAEFIDKESIVNKILPVGKYTASFNYLIRNGAIESVTEEFQVANKTSLYALSIEIANANNITLNKDYVYNEEFDFVITEGILINHDLTINGAGHTINAKGKTRIFNIADNTKLTIENLKLINGAYEGSGGAIYNNGELTINDSIFTNNTASNSGGAIYNNGELTINDSIFTNNTANNGGAIYNYHGDLTIKDSTLINNTATNSGGAIYNEQKINGSAIISKNVFIDNKATETGGAIYSYKWKTQETIAINNTFTNNTANNGSAIYVAGEAIDVSNNIYNNNDYTMDTRDPIIINVTGNTFEDIQNAVDMAHEGDTICLADQTYIGSGNQILVDKSLTFIGNNNVLDGQYLSIIFNITENVFNITFKNIKFTGGHDERYNGLIYSKSLNNNIINCSISDYNIDDSAHLVRIENPDSNVTIRDSVFENNFAEYLYLLEITSNNTVIDNCIFKNNSMSHKSGIYHESISMECRGNNIYLSNTLFNNIASGGISAVSLAGGNITVFNCTFDNLSVSNTSYGGCGLTLSNHEFVVDGRTWTDVSFNISKCTFRNSDQENLIFYFEYDYYGIGNITLTDNVIENCTGVLNIKYANHTIMKNCSFIKSETPVRITGITGYILNHTVEVYDCSFIESNAPISGNRVKDILVYNCSFDKCAAAISSVMYSSANATLTVLDCKFRNGTGDAIYLEKVDNFTINNCNFTGGGLGINGVNVKNFIMDMCNFINNSGSGIYLYSTADTNITSITNCNFENNSIYANGEIYMLYRSNSNATLIKNCTFIKNIAISSQYVVMQLWLGANKFILKDCRFENNSANESSAGSIAAIDSNNASITNCNFTNNFGNGAGCFDGTNSIVANCTFINNTGLYDPAGGLGGENNTIVDCIFINNSAISYDGQEGTGIFKFGGTNNLMANCTFENNTADHGCGALSFSGINSTVENCSFKNNHVESEGNESDEKYAGAMSVSFTSSSNGIGLLIKNCNFTNNYVKNKNGTSLGGAIRLGSGTVLNCNFINNSVSGSSSGGGAIAYLRYSNNTAIINCLFENNSASREFDDLNEDIAGGGGGAVFYRPTPRSSMVTSHIIANSTFINNKVISKYLNVTNSLSTMTISLEGYEEYINAIDIGGQYKDYLILTFSNVSYWDGEMLNTDDVPIIRSYMARNQPIVLEIYDSMGNLFKNITLITDSNGEVSLDYMDLPDGNYSYVTYHPDTDYYGYIMADPGEFIVKSSFEILQSLIDDATDNVTLKKDFTYSDSDLSELIINKTLTIYGNGHSIDANNMARIFNVSEGVTLTLVNVTLKNGQSDCGGAIFNNGTLVLIDSMLLNNNATNGGAIYNNPDCNVNLTNSVLANNTASYGGAIYSENGTISIINSTLSDNYAAWGAVFYSENGKISITDSLIDKNTASSFGVIYSKNDTVTMTNSTFSNNQGRRGGIDVEGSNWTISDSNFIANHAEIGGALENWGVTTIISSVLKDNTATQGNAIFAHNNNLTLDDVTFVDNGDSAIYCSDGVEVDTSNCKFLTGTEFEIENIPDFVNGTPITITVRETRNGESFNGNVTVSIGNYSYEIEVKNGTGSITVTPDLIFGKYTVKLSYNETETYFSSNAESSQFQVSNNPSIKIGNIANFVTGSNVTISVTAVDTFNGAVNVRIGGVDYEVDLINGSGSRTIALNLKGGSYKVTINFAGNENFTAENVTGNTFTVTKKATAITASAVTATYNVNKYLALTLKDKAGKLLTGVKVTIKLSNGKTYTKTTDKKGQVKLLVSNLIPKAYKATITYAGNDYYAKATKTIKVTVKKATPKMTAKAKTFKLKVKTKKYTITLKTNKNKVMKNTKVTLKVNKKTFRAKTNKKGVATFKITNLKKKGKFTAVITYPGNKYYKKLTKKAKITVKK